MRIAFIAPYQGPTLLQRRPEIRNHLSLGAMVKIQRITELLQRSSHDVEILSQGEVASNASKYYPSFSEEQDLTQGVPVRYASALSVKGINGFWSSVTLLRLFIQRSRHLPFDLVIVYNLKIPQVACANFALAKGLPVILEYEDDHFLKIFEPNFTGLTSRLGLAQAKRLLTRVSGCVANSLELLSQTPNIPKLLLPGVIDEGIITASELTQRRNWVIFSGTHSRYQGLEHLIRAWKEAQLNDWELHIAGHGDQTHLLQQLAKGERSIVFHGMLSPEQNAQFLAQGKIGIVPYQVDRTNGFSFKTLECLGAGLHVITTRLTALETLDPAVKAGLSYLDDNTPETIAKCLRTVIERRIYERTSQQATIERYGPEAVARSLNDLLTQVSPSG